MIAIVDGGRAEDAMNQVKVILLEDGMERHITVTHEGIIVDLVDAKGGGIVQRWHRTHDEVFEDA